VLCRLGGRRLGPGDPTQPAADLNIIPPTLIKRVEIVTGGASSVYGSDAVSGVINFILDTRLDGIRIDGQTSVFQHDNRNSYITPLFLRIPSAIMVYDLVAFAEFGAAHRRARLNERLTLAPALRRAARVICISEATRAELVARFPAAQPKAGTVRLAAGELFGEELSPAALETVRARHGLERPFVLALGTLEPRKNLPRLIEAFAALPPGLRDTRQLVLAGGEGWGAGPIRRAIDRHGPTVRALGWVPDEELAALYQSCDAFCYPSLHEGFGLPVLEAMRSGAVVVAAGVPSLREVAGDAAIYADPRDTGAIRTALEAALDPNGRRAELSARARERAAAFSWDEAARGLLRELERCLDRPH